MADGTTEGGNGDEEEEDNTVAPTPSAPAVANTPDSANGDDRNGIWCCGFSAVCNPMDPKPMVGVNGDSTGLPSSRFRLTDDFDPRDMESDTDPSAARPGCGTGEERGTGVAGAPMVPREFPGDFDSASHGTDGDRSRARPPSFAPLSATEAKDGENDADGDEAEADEDEDEDEDEENGKTAGHLADSALSPIFSRSSSWSFGPGNSGNIDAEDAEPADEGATNCAGNETSPPIPMMGGTPPAGSTSAPPTGSTNDWRWPAIDGGCIGGCIECGGGIAIRIMPGGQGGPAHRTGAATMQFVGKW